jgi:hypothetical protein
LVIAPRYRRFLNVRAVRECQHRSDGQKRIQNNRLIPLGGILSSGQRNLGRRRRIQSISGRHLAEAIAQLSLRTILCGSAHRADDLSCCCPQISKVAHVDRPVDAHTIQQGQSNRRQSIVFRRSSIRLAAKDGSTDAVSSVTGLHQNFVDTFSITYQTVLRLVGFCNLLQDRLPLLTRDTLVPRH